MTRQGALDLSGVNLYNENGGIVQGQICGQAIFTKLLRNNKNKGKGAIPLSHSQAVFSKEAGTLCMSPVGSNNARTNNKKTKLHRKNEYVNMNMSTIDTESESQSCSSDDVFSETTSSGSLNAALDDLQSPAFVAQFDPMQLLNPSSASQQEQQQHSTSSAARKAASSSWSASLPAVLEEDSKDSQSEQGSLGQGPHSHGIWRNVQSILTSPQSQTPGIDARDSSMDMPGQEGQVLLESDRIDSPLSLPNVHASPFQQRDEDQEDEVEVAAEHEEDDRDTGSSPNLMIPRMSKRRDQAKSAKDRSMREAVDRRIQQVMDEEFGQGVLPPPAPVEATASGDGSREDSPPSMQHQQQQEERQRPEDTRPNPFEQLSQRRQPRGGPPQRGLPMSSLQHHWRHEEDERHELQPAAVSNQMQDLLRQQQVTLKEMSLQNYHYRKELSECQEMFGQWRMEREQQQSTIKDLVKEKEAYASEASFLRNEMSSIRHELEALRREAQLHTGRQGQNPRQKQQEPIVSESPSMMQEPRNLFDDGPFMQAQLRFGDQFRSSPFMGGGGSPAPTMPNGNLGLVLPPPPPPPSNRPDTPTRMENHIGANKPDKPLVSKLKTTPTDPNKKKHGRSVTFHDPPKSKEWTLFPNNIQNDEDILDSAFEAQQRTYVPQQVRMDHHSAIHRPEGLHVHPSDHHHGLDHDVQEEEATPVAANGRVAVSVGDDDSSDDHEAASLYKYRLETIQRNRQQRVGREPVQIYGGPDNVPGKKKRRGRPAAV